MNGERQFLSAAEAASVLGISDDLVYQLIASGEIPAAVFGRRKLVPRRAVELVIERTLDGFDPNALLARLAAADVSTATRDSGDESGMAVGESTGVAESETSSPGVAASAASVLPLRRLS